MARNKRLEALPFTIAVFLSVLEGGSRVPLVDGEVCGEELAFAPLGTESFVGANGTELGQMEFARLSFNLIFIIFILIVILNVIFEAFVAEHVAAYQNNATPEPPNVVAIGRLEDGQAKDRQLGIDTEGAADERKGVDLILGSLFHGLDHFIKGASLHAVV